jgi:cyanate permease
MNNRFTLLMNFIDQATHAAAVTAFVTGIAFALACLGAWIMGAL